MAEKKNEKMVEEVEVKQPKKKAKKKTRRQIDTELRKLRNEIELEILNMSSGRCSYLTDGRKYLFSLDVGQTKVLSLDELQEVCFNAKSFFTNYDIVITDIYNDDYSIDDCLEFLGLLEIYEGIDGYKCDFVEEMLLEYEDDEFEKAIKGKNRSFLQVLASKLLYLHSKGKKDLWGKEHILKNLLGLDSLLGE